MRTSEKRINKILRGEIERTLVRTMAELGDEKKMGTFIRGFFTESEFDAYAKRLAVAYWLRKGRSYENIKENLKVSSATIANIAEMMKSEGFELALKSMEADEWANQWSEKIKKFVRK